jgi:hypothetical protein
MVFIKYLRDLFPSVLTKFPSFLKIMYSTSDFSIVSYFSDQLKTDNLTFFKLMNLNIHPFGLEPDINFEMYCQS